MKQSSPTLFMRPTPNNNGKIDIYILAAVLAAITRKKLHTKIRGHFDVPDSGLVEEVADKNCANNPLPVSEKAIEELFPDYVPAPDQVQFGFSVLLDGGVAFCHTHSHKDLLTPSNADITLRFGLASAIMMMMMIIIIILIIINTRNHIDEDREQALEDVQVVVIHASGWKIFLLK